MQHQQHKHFQASLELISQIAKEKGKVAALTETGNETLRVAQWFTGRLLPPLTSDQTRIAWVLTWRNANHGHFYVPYEGHHNEKDFKQFWEDPGTLFLSDVINPYKKR